VKLREDLVKLGKQRKNNLDHWMHQAIENELNA